MKKLLLFLLILVTSVGIIGCSSKPSGDPLATIEEYYSFINDKDYKSAYNLLSDKLKKEVDLEKFSKWQELLSSTVSDLQFKFSLTEENEKTKLDGHEIPYVAKVNVNRSWKSPSDNKKEAVTGEEYVIAENKEWKVYRLKKDFDIDIKIASAYNDIGWMYYEGKGFNKDVNKAIELFLNSIDYDGEYPYYYYSLSVALLEAQRYDESMNALNKIKELATDDKEMLSDAENMVGLIHLEKGELPKAKEYFNLALELNPNNQYAKTNLANLD